MRYMPILILFSFLSLCLGLNSCSMANLNTPCENHAAICKELRRQIVFNQASSDMRVINQQNAELPKLLKTYHDEGCD